MTDRQIAIRAEGLSKVFGNRVVLREVGFEVAEGECVALTGPNGSGKTTLLRCLASVLRPGSGEVQWFGRSASACPAARRLVGLVAHESFLYPHLTARENLVFAARMCDVDHPAQAAQRWLRDIGLAAAAERLSGRLSKGMRQRLAVARALVHDPRILFLDEPFSSLDNQGVDWLVGLLLGLRDRGRTVCFVTHDREKVRRLADRVFELRSGRVHELGTSEYVGPWTFPVSTRAA